MWKTLDYKNQCDLWKDVSRFLTDERNELFDRLLEHRTRHIVIGVEDVFHEHNSGALIRSAECFGIQDIHVMEDENNFKVQSGMAMGSENWVSIKSHKGTQGISKCVDDLKAEGYTIVAATPHEKDVILEDYIPNEKTAFFFGSEKTGVSPLVLEKADVHLRIPIYGATESFNVSVSSALILQNMRSKLNAMDRAVWELSKEEIVALKLEWGLRTLKKPKILVSDFFKRKGFEF
ncbi:MAG: rRNA methyltransferase [Crocinitomicaceae bacterium]|nr:rRNA methyltransferase [Crocinitomicaceae bacterium]|tara:strand:- start:79830 stop:80531 length:702 start_codon:yes stop_codon:yes gene_type:complete